MQMIKSLRITKLYDFVENPWSTKKAAKALKMKEDDIYESLSNLAEYMRNNIHIPTKIELFE